MDTRNLGKSGLTVSELCLGAMTFGRELSEKESFPLLDRFVDAGGFFIDTADVYSGGKSEEIVGNWLKGKDRDSLVIATKVRFGTGDPANRRANRYGLSRKHIMSAIDASLTRLKTDYVDLYQVHNWDHLAPLEETLSALNDIVHAGKARYIGASNNTGWQLQKALDISKAHGWERYVSLQPLYNLLDRELEWELLPLCREEGLGVMVWSPLRGGWLSGKFKRGMSSAPADSRVVLADKHGWSESFARYGNEDTWRVIDVLMAVAEEAGKTPAQVALRWVSQRPGITCPIIGARSMEQLEANLGAAGWTLSDEHMKRLEEVSEKPLPYPYDRHEELGMR